jgi:hypothetical protein
MGGKTIQVNRMWEREEEKEVRIKTSLKKKEEQKNKLGSRRRKEDGTCKQHVGEKLTTKKK